jgi:hypothetical protein
MDSSWIEKLKEKKKNKSAKPLKGYMRPKAGFLTFCEAIPCRLTANKGIKKKQSQDQCLFFGSIFFLHFFL